GEGSPRELSCSTYRELYPLVIASAAKQSRLPSPGQTGLLVRQASWRGPTGGSPVRVSRSGRPVVSVAVSSATAAAKRTQRCCGVAIEPRKTETRRGRGGKQRRRRHDHRALCRRLHCRLRVRG